MKRVLMLMLIATTASCETQPTVEQGNYLTFNHTFTDRAAGEVRKKAAAICAERGQAEMKISSACSLTRCVTNFQCVSLPAAAERPAER